jgi:soluble lytic murein transglycosylase-like protein
MDALKDVVTAVALLWATPAAADPTGRWSGYIAEASARFGVPEPWIRRVMRAESGGRTTLRGRPIVSHAGAMGLMQLMPGTWREVRASLRLGPDPHDPRDNILAGTFYLRATYDRFGYPGLFAAYNAGPARYARHLASGRRLPAETVAYVARIAGGPVPPPARTPAPGGAPVPAPPPPASLFAVLPPARAGVGEEEAPSAAGSALFVPLAGTAPR